MWLECIGVVIGCCFKEVYIDILIINTAKPHLAVTLVKWSPTI